MFVIFTAFFSFDFFNQDKKVNGFPLSLESAHVPTLRKGLNQPSTRWEEIVPKHKDFT
jgi:hypothetical protein